MSRRAYFVLLFAVSGFGVLVFNIYPIVWLMIGSVHKQPSGSFTLQYYRQVFSAFENLETIRNTFVLALGSIPLAALMGIVAALSTARIVTPLAGWTRAASIVAFVSPPWIIAMAYALLFAPNAGFVNVWFYGLFGIKPFNAFSMGCMIFVTALFLYPYIYLVLTASLENMDSSYEEAAITVGCSPLRALFTVTLPLVTPALLTAILFSFVNVWGLYSLPAVLGIPSKIYVFATYLWFLLNSLPAKLELSAALAAFFAVLSSLMFWGMLWLSKGYGQRFQVVAGRGHRSVRMDVPGLRIALTVANVVLVGLALIVPYAVLVAMSTSANPYRPPGPTNFTLMVYVGQLVDRDFLRITGNTVMVALGVGAVAGVLAVIVAYLGVRSSSRLREYLSAAAMFPIIVPGVAFVIGTAWGWLRPPAVLYGTLTVIIINQVARYLPLGVANVRTGFTQLHPSLEEAALTCGASMGATIRRIAVPLIRPAVMSTFLLLLLSSMQDLLSPWFLGDGTPRTYTLAAKIFFLWDQGNVSQSAALGVILVIVTFCVYIPVQRLLGRTSTRGA